MAINTILADEKIDRAAAIRRYEQLLINKNVLILNGHKVSVDKLIRDASLTSQGLKRLEKAITEDINITYKKVYQTTKKGLLDLTADQLSFGYQALESKVQDIFNVKNPSRRVAEEIVIKNPIYANKTLEAGFQGISIGERKRIDKVIRAGIAEGKTTKQIAFQVRSGSMHKISRNQSISLTVTATTSVTSQADQQVYEANKLLLRGWQYISVLDSRTTPICTRLDGKIFSTDDTQNLPPRHYYCRSTTIPVVKSWDDLSKSEAVAQIRKRNLEALTPKQRTFYDGQTSLRESYNTWLSRQTSTIQRKHLGSDAKVRLFQTGKLHIEKFSDTKGSPIGIRTLRKMTDENTVLSDTNRFTRAKEKLDSIHLGFTSPDELDIKFTNNLREYYLLQAGELDGILSLTNYRGILIGTKRRAKNNVLQKPPTDKQMIFNPITRRYDDARRYQPNPAVLNKNLKLVRDDINLKTKDKEFIEKFNDSLLEKMSVNERAAVVDNLRIMFTRFRKNGEPWNNFKAISTAQIKFDVTNTSDYIETQLRKNADILKKLKQDQYIDPVLGSVQLKDVHDNFFDNIRAKNKWEDTQAPKIARKLRDVFDYNIPLKLKRNLDEDAIKQFYLKFAHRLSLADSPDFDGFAADLGRDLYHLANYNGTRNEWYELGAKILKSNKAFFKIESYGAQKRRLKSRMSGQYFGQYYDTEALTIRIIDPNIQKYSKLTREVELGMRIPSIENRMTFREGSKTYWLKNKLGLYYDTRIPITSTSSFSDFPEDLIDKNMINALNWAGKAEYKVDEDFYDFTHKFLNFQDDKGRAQFFEDLNEYKHYIASRGDSYERFKAMEWLRNDDRSFSNNAFLDHRGRIYDRGLISPQSGETFLNRGL